MEEQIEISVLILVYNHEPYLEKALNSVLAQKTSYQFEVLVGEDCSPDHSKDILRKYERNYPGFFRVIYREKNVGGTKNAYDLLKKARGKYIAFLEGDDYWISNTKLQKQTEFLNSHLEYQGVAGNFCQIDQEGRVVKDKCIEDRYLGKSFSWRDFLKNGFVFQTATFMFRNYFLDGGDYSVFYKAHDLVSDLTNLTIILNRGDIFILPECLSAYRKVISLTATNACSFAANNIALSIYKITRQYAILNDYVVNAENYDYKIGEKKAVFLINMLKRRKGFTILRFVQIMKLGSWITNLYLIDALIHIVKNHFFNCNSEKEN